MKAGLRTKLKSLKRYFRENPGSFLILAFQVLLITAVVLLMIGNSSAANQMAVYAFFALFVGVTIEVADFILEGRKHHRAVISSDPPLF